jgi:hypothetical protein
MGFNSAFDGLRKFVNRNYSIILGPECIVTIYSIYNHVFSPTDAQLNRLKNNFKFVLKLTLKSTYVFRCENTILRDHTV